MKVLALVSVMLLVASGCANMPGTASVDDPNYADPAVDAQQDTTPVFSDRAIGSEAVFQPVSTSTPPAAPARTVASGTYQIKPGDTLFSLAKARYGKGSEWKRIAAANPGLDPHTLKVGQQIAMP